MIIFKFISAKIKQNLGLGCSKFYFRGQNKKINYIYIYIIFIFGQVRGFEPPGLAVEQP